jgi:membrane protease YdiL (CAAX protease family)
MAELTHPSTRLVTIRDQVVRHPLAAFIILAYAITWPGWFLSRIDLGVVNGFGVIGSAGPALAAMIVSALLRPEPSGVPAGKRWRLFGIIGIVTLALMAVRRLWITPEWSAVAGNVTTAAAYPSIIAMVVDVLAAAVVALCLSGILSPRQGVRDLLHSLDPRSQPVRWYWWVIALGLYPGFIALGNAISALLGIQPAAPGATGLGYWLLLDVLLTYVVLLFHGGGLEEPGWRGFALPLLQRRYSPLRSSLILAVLWAFWHWPVLQGGLLGMVMYLVLVVAPLAILFTAVFGWTRGSLPIAMLLHVSINVSPIFLPESSLATNLWLLLIVGLAFWMWRSPRRFLYRPLEHE